jgi:hypothetical protein
LDGSIGFKFRVPLGFVNVMSVGLKAPEAD